MESLVSEPASRDAILKPYKLMYASMTGNVNYIRRSVASNGPVTFFALENITCKVAGKTFQFDHANFGLFSWQVKLDETMIREGAKLEIYGLIEQYVRRSDDTVSYGIKRILTMRRA